MTPAGDGRLIWTRIEDRIDRHLAAIEQRAHLLLDRRLSDEEVATAVEAARSLARETGEMELTAIAQLARHIETTLEGQELTAVHAVQIAGTSEDIRALFNSAVTQQETRARTRGAIAIVGAATHDVDRIAWVLATRGHGVTHHPETIASGSEAPSGVILAFPDGFTASSEALVRVVGETSAVPTIALYDSPEPGALRTLATTCSSILPFSVSADLISAELERIAAVATATPVACAFGRIPRPASDCLRSHGFKIRRARSIDDLPRMLADGHAAVLFGMGVPPADVIATTRVIRAMPGIRRSFALWLTDDAGATRELADRMGILVVDTITDAVAARTSAVVRRDAASRSTDDTSSTSIHDWSVARVLTDRAVVAAYRASETLALAVIRISPSMDSTRLAGVHDVMSREFRRGDIVGQSDTHTLIVVLRGVSPRVATKRLNELIDRLEMADLTEGVGIAMFPADGGSADELMDEAHQAIDRAQECAGPKVVGASWRPDGSATLDVLLVESDEMLGRMLAAMIESNGYSVELLDNGDAAFERLSDSDRARPQLLTVDLDTSGMDGLSLIRRLRQRGSLAGSAILLMTSRSSESDLRVALDLGVTDIIRKPFSGTLALHRIERLLGEL